MSSLYSQGSNSELPIQAHPIQPFISGRQQEASGEEERRGKQFQKVPAFGADEIQGINIHRVACPTPSPPSPGKSALISLRDWFSIIPVLRVALACPWSCSHSLVTPSPIL